MATTYQQTDTIRFGGIDHRGDDLSRSATVADDSLNICSLEAGDEKTARHGFQVTSDNADNNGGFGAFAYNNPNGNVEELIVGSRLFKRLEGNISITYSGAGTSVIISLVPSESTKTVVCTIAVDDVEVFSLDLGVGYDEGSTVTVEDLKDAIDALSDFAAALTGPTSHPAAFIHNVWQGSFDPGYSLTFSYVAEVNHPTGADDPFQGSFDNRNEDAFENVTSIERNRCIYFANGYDDLKKYDGVDCYRAGVPKAGITSVVAAGSGSVGTSSWPDVYTHAATVVQKDAQGTEIEGMLSDRIETTISALSNFTVTLQNVQDDTGFNTDCAIVAGAQSGVTTITVDDGSGGNHTMKVGQAAYFYDGASSAYVERTITDVAATTITIDGANVNVVDNAVISNNLRIRVYRSAADSDLLATVVEVPNNSFAATQTYVDSVTDSNLGAFYDEAELFAREHALPPKFKYLTSYKNLLVGLGDINNPTSGYFSDLDNPEYWPDINQFVVESDSNQPITGGVENGPFLWVFKKNSTRQITGDLSTGQYDITAVSNKIGCVAHATIRSYDTVTCWLGEKTIYASELGSAPQDIGAQLRKFFRERDSERKPISRRAVGLVDNVNDRYLLFVPAESDSGGEIYANRNSRVFVYDFKRNEWHVWSNLNMAGGSLISGDDMYWVERRFSNVNSQMAYNIFKRHNTVTQFDFVDHVEPISCYYKPGWLHLNAPSVNKDFLSLKLYSNNSIVSSNFSIRLSTEIDFIRDVKHSDTTITFVGGTGLWGIGPWGGFSWGSVAQNAINLFRLKPKSVRAIRPTFSFSTFFNQVVLTAWEMEYATSHQPQMKF